MDPKLTSIFYIDKVPLIHDFWALFESTGWNKTYKKDISYRGTAQDSVRRARVRVGSIFYRSNLTVRRRYAVRVRFLHLDKKLELILNVNIGLSYGEW